MMAGAVDNPMRHNKKCFNPNVDPHVRIVVQPTKMPVRFRYECEGRTAGTIPGDTYTNEAKTYPTIKVMNYTGSVIILASCVTKSKPYRPHPNNLVGKDGCKYGVASIKMDVTPDNNEYEYQHLGIQSVRKSDIKASLDIRKKNKVDPFSTGFDLTQKIQMDVVRICFQVFLSTQRPDGSTKNVPLPPVVTNPIYDKKTTNNLHIIKTSEPIGPAEGGKEMIILCEKVNKEDIQVRFFKILKGKRVWSSFADLQPQNVHRQVAMSFRIPSYPKNGIQDDPVEVMVELYRPSDNSTSEPTPFLYLPYGYERNNAQVMNKKNTNIKESKELHDYLDVIPPTNAINTTTNNARKAMHRDQQYVLNIPNTHNNQAVVNHLPQQFQPNIAPNQHKRREITPHNSTIQPKKEPKLVNQSKPISVEPKLSNFDPVCLVDALLNLCSPQSVGENVPSAASDNLQPQPAPCNYPLIDISEPTHCHHQQQPINHQATNWNQLDGAIQSNYMSPSDYLFDNNSLLPLQNNRQPIHEFQTNYSNINQMQNHIIQPQPNYQHYATYQPNVSFSEQPLNQTVTPFNVYRPSDTKHVLQHQTLPPFQEIAQGPSVHATTHLRQHQHQSSTAGLPQLSIHSNELLLQPTSVQFIDQHQVPNTLMHETMENMTDSLNSLNMNEDTGNNVLIHI